MNACDCAGNNCMCISHRDQQHPDKDKKKRKKCSNLNLRI
uniref:Uncharacterized protein n=1 Tax=Anguilla anguilla TaxID=7936 RepID=A0A0E9TBW9_ANGAN